MLPGGTGEAAAQQRHLLIRDIQNVSSSAPLMSGGQKRNKEAHK